MALLAHQHRPVLALAIRLGAIAALSTMAMLIKLANARGINLLEILFWRQFISVPLIAGWCMVTGKLASLKTQRRGLHARRAIYGTIGMICNFGAVILLPLAEATTMGLPYSSLGKVPNGDIAAVLSI